MRSEQYNIKDSKQAMQVDGYQPTKDNLYYLLDKGDRALEDLLDTVILLVGKTKAGKSTTMQWNLSKPLIGYQDQEEAVVGYKNMQDEGAEIGQGFISSTLVPNIVNLDKQQGKRYSLADMAGYEDNRDYKAVITVSYMLKAVLEKAKMAKFIIVVTSMTLEDDNMKSAVDTFSEFVSMFDMKNMSLELREMIYDSTTLIITKSGSTAYKKRLEKLVKDFKKSKQTATKAYVGQLLAHICEKNKICLFPKSTPQQFASPMTCPLVEKLEDNDWKYLDIKEMWKQYQPQNRDPKQPMQNPIVLPYSYPEDAEEKVKFDSDVKSKFIFMEDFAKNVKMFIEKATQDGNWYREKVDYSACWKELAELLKKHNHYERQGYPGPDIPRYLGMERAFDKSKKNSATLFGVKLLRQLEIFYKNTLYIEPSSDLQEPEQLEQLKNHLLQAVKAVKAMFCTNYEQEDMLMKLCYIFSRTFRQNQMLREIDPLRIDGPSTLHGKIIAMELPHVKILQEDFISNQTADFKKKLSSSQQLRTDMINFIKSFREESGGCEEQGKFQVEICQISLLGENARDMMKDFKYIGSLELLLELLQAVQAYEQKFKAWKELNAEPISNNSEDEDDEEAQLIPEQYYIHAYEIVAECLKKMGTLESLQRAKNVYEHIRYIEPACQCWETMIGMTQSKLEKWQWYLEFGAYCEKNGRIDKIAKCYQEAYRFSPGRTERKKVKKDYETFVMDFFPRVIEESEKWDRFETVEFNEELNDEIQWFINSIKTPNEGGNLENNEQEEV